MTAVDDAVAPSWLSFARVDAFVPDELRADPLTLLRARLLLLYSATILAICPIFVGLSVRDGRGDLAGITATAMLVGSFTGLVLRRTRSIEHASTFAVATYAVTHATLYANAGYVDLSSLYWFASTPMFATFLRGPRAGLGWLAVIGVAEAVAYGVLPPLPDVAVRSVDLLGDYVGAFLFGAILLSFGAVYEVVRNETLVALRAAKQLADAAREQAEESGRARSRLIAGISHELRTPMSGVVGITHLLEKTPLDATQREQVDLIRDSGDAMISILNDLLEFSRIDVGPVALEQRTLDPRRVVNGVVGLFGERAAGKALQLRVVVEDDVPQVLLGDARRVRQVLWNLVGNAVKFTDHGEVVVHVARLPDDDVSVARVRFIVQDTGPGIDDNARARLFQPFVRGHADPRHRFEGTGLGLAISRNLVVALGGDGIELDSTRGVGSRFSFVVPMRVAAATQLTQPARGRVLVVEDDAVSARVACRMVEAAGHACDVVGDGRAAIDAALQGDYDLILMDGNLPGVDGYVATRAIRAGERHGRRVPIVALTATSEPHERDRAIAAGMDDHQHKPLDPSRLGAILAQHLRPAS